MFPNPIARARVLVSAAVLAALVIGGATPAFVPSAAEAATCVKFVASRFDSPGNDNYMPQLNGEWVRIKNTCSTAQNIGRWRIHDYKAIHTYRFPAGLMVGAGKSITLKSGKGTNTATVRFWQRTYGAVWNNTSPERAYLKKATGTLVHSWSEY